MMAESPLTSVDFMSDGGTLAVGSTRGIVVFVCCFVCFCFCESHVFTFLFLAHINTLTPKGNEVVSFPFKICSLSSKQVIRILKFVW